MIRRLGAALLSLAMTATLVIAVREPARAAALCATPGRDASPTITGVVNTYFTGSANAAAGATSITVGAHAAGDASVAIASGDLLLVIQMQGATINTSNSVAYGDGSTGSGATSSTAGTYEYVVANGALATTGGTVAIKGTNANGLINAYTTGGGAHFQVIRVPQYVAPTVGGALAPLAWNGTAGGVLAIDAQNLLFGNGATVSANGKGFRGGQGRGLTGDATAGAGDYVNSNAKNVHGQKGEGTAGTPTYLYTNGVGTGSGTANGYTGGDTGRGAPGNAGGGGADAHVTDNAENTGGGGGGNGGAGGVGGKSWNSNLPYGGLGGKFTPSAMQLVMGGGGGAGSRNNGSNYDSSGGTGGGIVMMRVAGVTGGLTITANGTMGVDPQNDGGGGGGAGGSVMMTAPSTFAGVTVTANGANGTDADILNGGNAAHGPGGGGGGGVEVDSGGITPTLNGGAAGVTDGSPTPDAHYGAAAGANGQVIGLNYINVPGASSGAECGSSSGTIYIGPVGVPLATGSYDGNVNTTNNNDFVEKSFAPPAFNAINSSTIVGSPNGNTYGAAVTGIALRHEVHNTSGGALNVIYYAQAPSAGGSWTVTVNNDNAGALGTVITGTATGNAYQTTATVSVPANSSVFVWTVYAAPTGLQAFNRFDALLGVIDAGNVANNNEVHDELYSGYVVQTKSYTITSTGCSGGVPAGTWCPGGVLKYTIDVRNIAVAANGTTPASATLTANNLTLTDDGSNPNSWAKDGGYMNTPGYSSTGTAPTTVTYYYNLTSNTVFPASYSTTNKVFKVTSLWSTLAAGTNSQFMFSAVQF